jgi:acyl carrier protein
MADSNGLSTQARVSGVVQRLLAERSIDRPVAPHDDLREAGLSSLDMVSLVLSIEDEFGLTVPEASIVPANFRSIAAVGSLVDSLQGAGNA